MIFIIKGFWIIVFIFIVNNKDEGNSPKTLNDKEKNFAFLIRIFMWRN